MENKVLVEISLLATPILLAIIAFFLRSLYARFDNLEREVKQTLIDSASFHQRVIQLEKEVEDIRRMVLEIFKK